MKRKILAAIDPRFSNHPYLEEIRSEASMAGYEIVLNTTIQAIPTKDAETMPMIFIDTTEQDGALYFDCTLVPPELHSIELSAADSIEHWVRKWMSAARFCTWLQKNPLVWEHWEAE